MNHTLSIENGRLILKRPQKSSAQPTPTKIRKMAKDREERMTIKNKKLIEKMANPPTVHLCGNLINNKFVFEKGKVVGKMENGKMCHLSDEDIFEARELRLPLACRVTVPMLY